MTQQEKFWTAIVRAWCHVLVLFELLEKNRREREKKCVCVRACACVLTFESVFPLESGSSGTRQGLASARQLTARASLRPSNTSAHEPVNNSLKLMHAPHQQIPYSPNG